MRYLPFLLFLALAATDPPARSEEPASLPKYRAGTLRLHFAHEYLQKRPAPDFWALMPYYLPQQDGKSCSVASVTMVVNASRAGRALTAKDELATQKAVLDQSPHEGWLKFIRGSGKEISLDDLPAILDKALKSYGVEVASARAVRPENDPEEAAKAAKLARFKAELHRDLVENEKSADDFIVANFNQGTYTGDPEGGGHIAPVGAYDAPNRRVLVLDPDRQYYEPYWVSEDIFAQGMATLDSSNGKLRGYVHVKVKAPKRP